MAAAEPPHVVRETYVLYSVKAMKDILLFQGRLEIPQCLSDRSSYYQELSIHHISRVNHPPTVSINIRG